MALEDIVIGGDPEHWNEEFRTQCRPGYAGTFNSDDVCSLQKEQAVRGRQVINLVHTIYGYTWRDASGLSRWAIRWSGRTLEDAFRWAKEWAAKDPEKRAAIVSRGEIASILKSPLTSSRHKATPEDVAMLEDLL